MSAGRTFVPRNGAPFPAIDDTAAIDGAVAAGAASVRRLRHAQACRADRNKARNKASGEQRGSDDWSHVISPWIKRVWRCQSHFNMRFATEFRPAGLSGCRFDGGHALRMKLRLHLRLTGYVRWPHQPERAIAIRPFRLPSGANCHERIRYISGLPCPVGSRCCFSDPYLPRARCRRKLRRGYMASIPLGLILFPVFCLVLPRLTKWV
jgi:hypothetical protein